MHRSPWYIYRGERCFMDYVWSSAVKWFREINERLLISSLVFVHIFLFSACAPVYDAASSFCCNDTPSEERIPHMVFNNAEMSLKLMSDSSLWGVGWNVPFKDGGIYAASQTSTYTMIPARLKCSVKYVSKGLNSIHILKTDDSLWASGLNNFGQLGDGTRRSRDNLVHIMNDVVSIHGDMTHKFAITSDNTLWAWGNNHVGQLGDGTTVNRRTPIRIKSNVSSVVSHINTTFAIDKYGVLWGWGRNSYGTLGDGTGAYISTPKRIKYGAATVWANETNAMAIGLNGDLWAWGDNSMGQVGDGTTADRSQPVHILDNVATIAMATKSSFAVSEDGVLFAWGNNNAGQLWDKTTENRHVPVEIAYDVSQIVLSYASRQNLHSDVDISVFIIKNDDTLWAWGANNYGQLGNGTFHAAVEPEKIKENAASLFANFGNIKLTSKNGNLWGWGKHFTGYGFYSTRMYNRQNIPLLKFDSETFAPYYHILFGNWTLSDTTNPENEIYALRQEKVRELYFDAKGYLFAKTTNLNSEITDVQDYLRWEFNDSKLVIFADSETNNVYDIRIVQAVNSTGSFNIMTKTAPSGDVSQFARTVYTFSRAGES